MALVISLIGTVYCSVVSMSSGGDAIPVICLAVCAVCLGVNLRGEYERIGK